MTRNFLLALAAVAGIAAGQTFGVICSTDAPQATGPNNSHKLACRSELISVTRDTVTLVFQSSQGVNMSMLQGGTWSRPALLYPGGWYPAIDFGEDGDRHLVWEARDSSAGSFEVYYRNLEYRMAPVNVSEYGTVAEHPDVCADDSGLAHVVWAQYESLGTRAHIAYRGCSEAGGVGETYVVSADSGAYCSQPSVEVFGPDRQLCVVWQQADLQYPYSYSIVRRRQVGGAWQDVEVLMQQAQPLDMPSLDADQGQDAFSSAWCVTVAGNREVHFEGGNGGGYSTPGASMAPVICTMDGIWSYLFWEEDDNGRKDICGHFFYWFPPPGHWYFSGTLRQLLSINENIRAPSCLGALVVWTQGDAPPYKVMWAYFDYPIPVEESRQQTANGPQPAATIARGVLLLPRSLAPSIPSALLDISGRKAMDLRPGANDVRHLPAGVYFVREAQAQAQAVRKVVVAR